jgi:hypothetical protein
LLFSALYYPHTELSANEPAGNRLLKRALLLWDQLEFIVPFGNYRPYYGDSRIAEAIDVIGKNHVPSDDEKKQAHERIEELVTRPGVPDAFLYHGSDPYEVYPQKFLESTWDLLHESKFAGKLLPDGDYPMNPQVGLTIMAILADCCAGATRSRVTDRVQAYAGLTGLLGEQDVEGSMIDRTVDATLRLIQPKEQLLSLRLPMISIDQITLDQLLAFRKREASTGGHSLRDLRHRYLERIEKQVKELAGTGASGKALTQSDIEELERRFLQESEDDVAALQEELKLEWTQTLLSKDVLLTFLGVVGSLGSLIFPPAMALAGVFTASGAAVTVGGVLATRSKLLKARADLMRKHPMAFLYELGQA